MGVGDPLEAAFTLRGPIGAGRWHLTGDGIVLSPADLQIDVLWRRSGSDQLIVRFEHHFEADAAKPFDAVPFDGDAVAAAVAARSGDRLILRYNVTQSTMAGAAFIPNADGSHAHGRIPSLTLP